jgi:histone H4
MPSKKRSGSRQYANGYYHVFTKPAVRRLCRRAGVKRIHSNVYDATRLIAKDWLTELLKGTIIYTENDRRKTVSAMDVIHGIKRMTQSEGGLLGYGYKVYPKHIHHRRG